MNNTTREQLRKHATHGFKEPYGEHPDKQALLRLLSELRRIDMTGYSGYYLMAYRIFCEMASTSGIKVWPRGAVASSVVCYSLGLTDVDPVRYGLHSARFVNEEPPKFQFDIEAARFDEFNAKAAEVLKDNSDLLDFDIGRKYLLGDIEPMSYLNSERESPMSLPDNLDNEIAEYALTFPDTTDLYHTYRERKNGAHWEPTGIEQLDEILAPTYGLLAYQEQMMDILKYIFREYGTRANDIRPTIQRGDTERINALRTELQATAAKTGIGDKEFGTIWEVLTSNPKAFLKAHAVSRVLSKYYF